MPLLVADDTTDEEFFGTTKTTEKYRDNFYSMCRDGPSSWRNATVDSALRCRTVHFNDPYLKLGPFKMEEKSDRPFLVVFYDFLTGKELKVSGCFPRQSMGNYSTDSIFQAFSDVDTRIFDRSQTAAGRAQKIRTSKQGWLREQDYKVYSNWYETQEDTVTQGPLVTVGAKVSKRIELATRTTVLRNTASEPYQIVNYGLGGA